MPLRWALVAMAIGGRAARRLDGWLARAHAAWRARSARASTWRSTRCSILVLSALVWRFGKAGPWVLASGLMRYVFVAAALVVAVAGRAAAAEPAAPGGVRGADRRPDGGPRARSSARRSARCRGRGGAGGAGLVVRGRREWLMRTRRPDPLIEGCRRRSLRPLLVERLIVSHSVSSSGGRRCRRARPAQRLADLLRRLAHAPVQWHGHLSVELAGGVAVWPCGWVAAGASAARRG